MLPKWPINKAIAGAILFAIYGAIRCVMAQWDWIWNYIVHLNSIITKPRKWSTI